MRSLITGGAGFIGSHLVDAMLARGDDVLVLDDLSTGRESNLEGALAGGAKLEQGDVSDRDFVASRVASFAPDRVFHLAAQADVRRANEDPQFDARVNVIGTINVLEAVRAAGGGASVVFAATGGAVYGEGKGGDLPFDESTKPAPETAYGVSKFSGEAYVGLFRRLHGTPGVALRFGNIYGPRQDPHGEAGVVAIFCGKLLAGERAKVFGDGLQTRDYVYVGDAVGSLVAASDALAERGTDLDGPLNIGTGIESSVLDLLRILAAHASVEADPEFAPARPGEVQQVVLDATAARRELGWAPEVDLTEGLARTFDSMRDRG